MGVTATGRRPCLASQRRRFGKIHPIRRAAARQAENFKQTLVFEVDFHCIADVENRVRDVESTHRLACLFGRDVHIIPCLAEA